MRPNVQVGELRDLESIELGIETRHFDIDTPHNEPARAEVPGK